MTTDPTKHWGALAFVPAGLVLALARVLAWAFVEGGPVAAGFFDAGQVLAMSLVCSVLLHLGEQLRSAPSWLPWCGLSCLAFCLGAFVLPDDFDSFSRGQAILPQGFVLWGSVFLASQSLVLAALLGRWLNRPLWRSVALLACATTATANGLLLKNDYRGIHLFVAGSGLIVAGAAYYGARRNLPRYTFPLVAVCTVGAALSAFIPPSGELSQALYNSTGAAFHPLFSGWSAGAKSPLLTQRPGSLEAPLLAQEWLKDRKGAPAIPSTHGALLGKSPLVVLITVDALRADVVESGNYDQDLPTLARLRDEGILFTQARATGTLTKTSISGLFLGNHFSQQFWSPMKRFNNAMSVHADPSVRFTELLAARGAATANFRSVSWLRNRVVMRGFQHDEHIQYPKEKSYYTPSPPVFRRLLPHVKKSLKRRKPAFIYSHLADPHAPYDQGKVKRGSAFDRYLSEVALVDSQLTKLVKILENSPHRDSVLLIISADHGEAFGEHNSQTHGTTLYDEVLRVPLIFWRPQGTSRTIETPVSLLDLGPTVMDLFGVETPSAAMGQSLAGCLLGEEPILTRPIFAETRLMRTFVTSDLMKLIMDTRSPRVELYDLKKDPGETKNLSKNDHRVLPLLSTMNEFFSVHTLRRDGYTPPFVR